MENTTRMEWPKGMSDKEKLQGVKRQIRQHSLKALVTAHRTEYIQTIKDLDMEQMREAAIVAELNKRASAGKKIKIDVDDDLLL